MSHVLATSPIGRVVSVLVLCLVFAESAAALNCPRNLGCGIIGCACGDTVVSDFQMTSDITCPSGHTGFGLKVASGVSLRSAQQQVFQIIGPGTMSAGSYGILIENTTNTSVLLVRVRGFRDGVRVQNATDTILWGVDASNNGAPTDSAGIRVSGGSGNGIYGCIADTNGDAGIRVANTSGTIIMGSFAQNNAHTNVDLASANNGELVNNTTAGGTASIYIKHCNGNVFTTNTFQDGPVTFAGSSAQNDFGQAGYGNTIIGGRLEFRQLEDSEPNNNRVLKPQIINTGAGAVHCIDFAADPGSSPQELAYANIISEANLTCNAEELHVGAGAPVSPNILCACTGTGGGACDVLRDPGAPDIIAPFNFPCL